MTMTLLAPTRQKQILKMKNFALVRFWNSSIGKKIIVAVTGIALVLFLAGHLAGNLLMYKGPTAFNEYAEFLHTFGKGVGIWAARFGLLGAFVLHIAATICLVIQNREAKEKSYEQEVYKKASHGSRLMIWSGLTILLFVVFHIFHFTIRVNSTLADAVREDGPYQMVILGFQNILVVIFYIIAMTCLCSHLSHGVASIFQTLGLRTRKNADLISYGAWAYTVIIYVGFISIPLAIYFGLIK